MGKKKAKKEEKSKKQTDRPKKAKKQGKKAAGKPKKAVAVCPGCKKRCSLTALKCGKGRKLLARREAE